MTTNWRDVLIAYLHDPPDKAMQIRGHESRARKYLRVALGDDVSESELKDPSDPLAAIAERLPAPHWETLKVSADECEFVTWHPLSGAEKRLFVSEWSPSDIAGTIEQLVQSIDDTERRFLVLWRGLAEKLAIDHHDTFERLPADTRVPDHTLWQHLDTTAALKAAEAGSSSNAAFLSFSLGPVQPFIAAARSLRDLWSGSMILARLTFEGMLPVIEQFGPTALVYPALRGLPWLDLWLRDKRGLGKAIPAPSSERRTAPCIPNRFLAIVPSGLDGDVAREIALACRQRALEAWQQIARSVHDALHQEWGSSNPGWDARWSEQIDHYFEIRTSVLPWRDCGEAKITKLLAADEDFASAFPDAAAVRTLADAIPRDQRPRYDQKSAGNWQAKVELSARLMQAHRSIRHVPPSTTIRSEGEQFPPKCSLLGSYEQMGPAGLDESREFWERATGFSRGGVRVRDGERFSAVALVKRFCGPCYFRDALSLNTDDLRHDDTATVAAGLWLENAGIQPDQVRREHGVWSGQWLHWSHPDQEDRQGEAEIPRELWTTIVRKRRDQPPPAYYAVLMLDGDDMGRWLRGEKSPRVREIMHPKLREYYEEIPAAHVGLNVRRPVGPALHAAISEALANFALHFVPEIVERHKGSLIYAGGDDVLALLPTSTALAVAKELSDTFRSDWPRDAHSGRERLLMGQRATVSAGLAVVHYKEDLRFALDAARRAEKEAKNSGRNALQIHVCRRSGEHATALCPWDFVPTVLNWIEAFDNKASDRWAYHLRAEAETLQGLSVDAMQAEIKRQVNRAEQRTRGLFGGQDPKSAGDQLATAFDDYRAKTMRPPTEHQPAQPRLTDGEAFLQFITLCQTASFLARGRDQ
ncbi:MAG: type III-B CRISPR-associated protein Cas10/Cmr2 [Planctomycetaceae bacterium]|nr:MAG: type III-B CRISPR-associated protein Cas10/Cmr2 [Planctomycetaceae bacterium]